MALGVADFEGRLVLLVGQTGVAGTSVNLNTVGVTTVAVPSSTWQRWLPLVMVLTRFSTGSGAVPTATVSAGTVTAAAPIDFKAGAPVSGNGPFQIFFPLTTMSPYNASNTFLFAVTAGAVGTCDVALYAM